MLLSDATYLYKAFNCLFFVTIFISFVLHKIYQVSLQNTHTISEEKKKEKKTKTSKSKSSTLKEKYHNGLVK